MKYFTQKYTKIMYYSLSHQPALANLNILPYSFYFTFVNITNSVEALCLNPISLLSIPGVTKTQKTAVHHCHAMSLLHILRQLFLNVLSFI